MGNCAMTTRGGAAGGIISQRRSLKASDGGVIDVFPASPAALVNPVWERLVVNG